MSIFYWPFSRRYRTSKVRSPWVCAPDEFRQSLRCELARSRRFERPLSLLVFELLPALARVRIEDLNDKLRKQLRIYDRVSLLENGILAALLPETTTSAAEVVARKMRNALGSPDWLGPSKIIDLSNRSKETNDGPPSGGAPAHPDILQEIPWWKRLEDVVGASVLLVVLSPLLAAVAACIWLGRDGPVLFKQRRSGRGGKPFVMYKFRTMVADAERRKAALLHLNERDGPAFKLAQDPRVTWIGRTLRRTCIDELPQLVNVIRGEMSLVGPRPLPCQEQHASQDWHQERLDVLPGITCFWQAQLDREMPFDDWMRLDICYVRHQSPATDLRILGATVTAILGLRGLER